MRQSMLSPKHADEAKTSKPHASAKPTARTNALKAKAAKKKHPDPKHNVKKTTTKPKPHPSTTTAQ